MPKRYERYPCECVVWMDDKAVVMLEGEEYYFKPLTKCSCPEPQFVEYHYLELDYKTQKWDRHHGVYCAGCFGLLHTG